RAIEPTGGEILFKDEKAGRVNIPDLGKGDLRKLRESMQMIFQDPYSSLNPRKTILEIVSEPMRIHGIASGKALQSRVEELLELVGLRSEYVMRYPHAFSGGQRQRIGIARALSLNPQFIVADEPVSALDVSVQAQVLNLMRSLQRRLGLTYLFISHDLSVVKHISDRIAVMYVGNLVETASTQELFVKPLHPYTEALLSSVPKPDPRLERRRKIPQGEVADPAHPPPGCRFHPRCPYVQPRCAQEAPALREFPGGRTVACHYAEQLTLTGALATA
ncbi:MAG: hypothetical protein QG637_447, partial [Chloroflexota bacterium]|nr:hypothetical protein [Chloroflexota bacterium]